MNCVVTGGLGFIGRHLTATLCGQGHNVTVVDNLSAPGSGSQRPLHGVNKCYDDIRRDVLDFTGADVVFHLAAVSRTVPAIKDPVRCIETNVLGTANVLEAARRGGVPRVVVSSSNVVYAGTTVYRASKLAAEGLCEVYNAMYGSSVIALRYSNVYGPNIPVGDEAVFAALRDSYNKNGYVELTGDGTQTRDFTHVSDIVRGNILAWKSTVTGNVDLCTGVNTSLMQACWLLDMPIRYIPAREGDVPFIHQNPIPARSLLGWKAEVKIEDGIKDIWTV